MIDTPWNLPQSLEGGSLTPWPSDVFPPPFEDFVREVSRSTESPIELSAMMLLSAVATTAHKHYVVQIKSDYFEPVNLWTVVVLPPSTRKSVIFKEITGPLMEWEMRQRKALEPLINSLTSKRKTHEDRIKELRKKASRAKESEFESLQMAIEEMELSLEEIPSYPQIWCGDVTSEHLGTLMNANDEAISVLSDEAGIFDILSGLYSDGRANIDLFLQGYSGSSVRVDRGSRSPLLLKRATITLGLTIQPQALKNIGGNKTFRGRGLLGRCLFALPKSNIGKRTFDEPPIDPAVRDSYNTLILQLLNSSHNGVQVSNLKTLKLSPAAYQKWHEYARANEILMGEDLGLLSHITDWAGKLPGNIARIAGLIHIMRYADQCPWIHEISLEIMAAATKIGHALTSHALKTFELVQEMPEISIAREVRNWLQRDKLSSVTGRDITRKFRYLTAKTRGPTIDLLTHLTHELIENKTFIL